MQPIGRLLQYQSRATLAALALLLTLVSGCKEAESSQSNGDPIDVSAQIATLQEELWNHLTASSIGLRFREGIPLGQLDDLSFENYQDIAARARHCVERIAALDLDAAVNSHAISEAEWVDAKAIAWDCSMTAESERWFWHFNVLASYSSPLPPLGQLFAGLPLETAEQRTTYLDLLAQLPRFIGQLEQRAKGQAERGIYLWRANHATAVGLVRSLIAAEDSPGPYGIKPDRLDKIELEDHQDGQDKQNGQNGQNGQNAKRFSNRHRI